MESALRTLIAAAALLSSAALADEAKTVTLTEPELNAIATAVQAREAAQLADAQAKAAMDKVRAAFAPPAPPTPSPAPAPPNSPTK